MVCPKQIVQNIKDDLAWVKNLGNELKNEMVIAILAQRVVSLMDEVELQKKINESRYSRTEY